MLMVRAQSFKIQNNLDSKNSHQVQLGSNPFYHDNTAFQMQKLIGNRATQKHVQRSITNTNENVIQRQLLHKSRKELSNFQYYKELYKEHKRAIDYLEKGDKIIVNNQNEFIELILKTEREDLRLKLKDKYEDKQMYQTRNFMLNDESIRDRKSVDVFQTFVNKLKLSDRLELEIANCISTVSSALTQYGRMLTKEEATNEERAAEIIMSSYRAKANPNDSDLNLKILRYILTGEQYTRGHVVGGLGDLKLDGNLTGRPDFDINTQEAFKNRAVIHHIRHITAWHNIRNFLNMSIDFFKDNEFTANISKLLNSINEAEKLNTNKEKGIGDRFNQHYKNKMNPMIDIDTPHKILMKTAFYMNSSIKNLWAGSGKENVARNTFGHFLNEKKDEVTIFNIDEVIEGVAKYTSSVTNISLIKNDLVKDMKKLVEENKKKITNPSMGALNNMGLLDEIKRAIEISYRKIEIDKEQGLFATKNGPIHEIIMKLVRKDADIDFSKIDHNDVYKVIKEFLV
jgi:hypothetical protein